MFVNFLQIANWTELYSSTDLNRCVTIYTEIVTGAMAASIPRRSKSHRSFPVWFSKELRLALCKKKRTHKCYLAHRRAVDYEEFSAIRTCAKALLKRDRSRHFNTIANEVNVNPKAFWKFLSPHFRDAYYSISLQEDQMLVTDPNDLCSKFGEFFESIVSQNLPVDVSHVASDIDASPVDVFTVTEADVVSASQRMRPIHSTGPDGIPPFLLKGSIVILTPILAYIFNLSLVTGEFPNTWKVAAVFPVHKSGSRLDLRNYRPISNLCSTSKLFEHVISAVLVPWTNVFLTEDQFGFVSGRSLEMNLLSMLYHAAPRLFSRGQFDMIYLDFGKAFDMVNHDLLLLKLRMYGMPDSFVKWFRAYLKGRQFYVRCNDFSGEGRYDVLSGVPQGSVLGPLLFIIFVNDILRCTNSAMKWLFADDTKTGSSIDSLEDCNLLQSTLNEIADWAHINGMKLNALKSSVLSYTRKATWLYVSYILESENIPRNESQRDLGVIF